MSLLSFPNWDQELFLYINGKHTPMLDPVMKAISSSASWAIVFILIVALIIYKNRYWGKRAAIFLVAGLATNSIVNTIVKYIVMRPRPGNTPAIQDMVHQLGHLDNSYSFFSAHSSNSFCLALFAALFFRNKYYSVFLLLWAIVVAYSRIYVGRHFPIDVICGSLFGLFTGWASYWMYQNYVKRKSPIEESTEYEEEKMEEALEDQ